MTSTCQLSRNGSSKTLEEPFVKVEILRRDCPSRSPHFNPLRPCGRRRKISASLSRSSDFNPLRPCGRRLRRGNVRLHLAIKFQSTPPVWAETCPRRQSEVPSSISIHSARVGGDQIKQRGEHINDISIHSARVGGDYQPKEEMQWHSRFQSTPPV